MVQLPDSSYHWCIVSVLCGNICLVSAGLGNSSKPQIRLNEGRIKNKAIGYDSDQQIHNFTESSGEWIYVVDVVKLSNFGGCLVVALTRKGRTPTFMRDETVAGAEVLGEIKPTRRFNL